MQLFSQCIAGINCQIRIDKLLERQEAQVMTKKHRVDCCSKEMATFVSIFIPEIIG